MAASSSPTYERIERAGLMLLLAWTALTTVIFWLMTLRSLFDGPSYEWGLFAFRGQGIHGDYWLPVTGAILAIVARASGLRGAGWPFRVLALAWHGFLAWGVVYLYTQQPDLLRWRGDTLNVDLMTPHLALVLFVGGALLAVGWNIAALIKPLPVTAGWTRLNGYWAVGLALLWPIQWAVLHFGPADGTSDVIGVWLVIIQWLCLGQVFRPPGGVLGSYGRP